MNIDQADSKRLEIALEQFEQGLSITYAGVLFQLSRRGALQVNSYSEFADPTYINVEMAKSGIERSKVVLATLFEEQPKIMNLAGSVPREYYYCCDYQTGAFAVAKEESGLFTWLLKSAG